MICSEVPVYSLVDPSGNYMCICCKLLEQIVYNISTYLTYNIISKEQHGFRKQHALIIVKHTVNGLFNAGSRLIYNYYIFDKVTL